MSKVRCTCVKCGKLFETTPSEIKLGKGEYCSWNCRATERNIQINCVCEQCGAYFSTTPYHIRIGKAKYCNSKCEKLSRQSYDEGLCIQCGAVLVKIGYGKYCSRRCIAKAKQQKYKKFRYSGRNFYRGPNWYQQRKLAYERDQGICQHCGKKPRKDRQRNAIHHIRPYREFHGDYLSANQLTNLITLCGTCHPKAEHGMIAISMRLF